MDAEPPADFVAIGQMRVELGRCLVNGFVRGAAQLELAAGLERDAADRAGVAQADGVAVVVEIFPALTGLDAGEERVDAVVTLVLDGADRGFAVDVLFVLGADAPLSFGLAAARQRLDHLRARREKRRELGAGHGYSDTIDRPGTRQIRPDNRPEAGRKQPLYRQSPMIDCTSVKAATAAVSARRMRGPRLDGNDEILCQQHFPLGVGKSHLPDR